MSTRSIHQALTIVFALSLSSVALARNPAVLVKQQQAAAQTARESAGYRDISWRFGDISARAPEVKRVAGGYRDIRYRFGGASLLPTHSASTATTTRWR